MDSVPDCQRRATGVHCVIARPRIPMLSFWHLSPPLQAYSVKAFGSFFTWVFHAEEAAVHSLANLEQIGAPVTMNQMKFLQGLYDPSFLQRVAADMTRPKVNIKDIQDRASHYLKQQWVNWHWQAAPDNYIHPSRSMLP